VDEALADWWQEFSMADDSLRQDLVDQVRAEQQQRKPAPRVQRAPAKDAAPKKSAPADADSGADAPERNAQGSPDEDGHNPPRKRRRRRRSGAAKGTDQGAGNTGEGGSADTGA
jgi:poly(A) polymerase